MLEPGLEPVRTMPQIPNPMAERKYRRYKMPKEGKEDNPTIKRNNLDEHLAKRCYYMKMDGFSGNEIARRNGISPQRVRSIIKAAKKRGLV